MFASEIFRKFSATFPLQFYQFGFHMLIETETNWKKDFGTANSENKEYLFHDLLFKFKNIQFC